MRFIWLPLPLSRKERFFAVLRVTPDEVVILNKVKDLGLNAPLTRLG
jgi:hypothetical protein